MINVNKLNKILYNDYGIILNESENAYLKYLNNTSDKDTTGILKEFFTKCTTRHLCIENNKKDLYKITKKLIKEGPRSPSSDEGNIHGSTDGAGIVDITKYLNNEDIVEIEEETNTLNGNEGLNVKRGKKSINKEFETKEEADRYRQEIANKALVNDGGQHMNRRVGGGY
tara:strand:+ start:15472 stop:15981 length:510 start_codon:yes stop_codon:yes gene_type:complete